jgi:high frequency lysogenization protein
MRARSHERPLSEQTPAPSNRDVQQARAFAAIVQASVLVGRIAHNHEPDTESVRAVIDGIFATDLDDADTLFADLVPWRIGIESGYALLGRPGADLSEAAKHTVTIVQIALDLRKHRELGRRLRSEIQALDRARSDLAIDATMAELGAIYQRTLSTLPRRVHVTGDPSVLQRPAVASRIRSLLLGGVRAAWLWHSLGGRRWHLLLKRSTMRRALRISLDALHRPPIRH